MIVAAFDVLNGALLAFFLLPLGTLMVAALGNSGSQTAPPVSKTAKLIVAVSVVGFALGAGDTVLSSNWLRLPELVAAVVLFLIAVVRFVPVVPQWWQARARSARIAIGTTGAFATIAVVVAGSLALGAADPPDPPTKTADTSGPSREKLLATYGGRRYQVYGTCVQSHCGLNERPEPDIRAEPAGARHAEGSTVVVVCQTSGAEVSEPPDQKSSIWDQLDNGKWVTDLYVSTPRSADGKFSAEIKRCR